jgi:hypothetical protein
MVVSLFDQFISEKNLLQTYQRIATNGSMDSIDRILVSQVRVGLEKGNTPFDYSMGINQQRNPEGSIGSSPLSWHNRSIRA